MKTWNTEAIDLMTNFVVESANCKSVAKFQSLLESLKSYLGFDRMIWWYGVEKDYLVIDTRPPEWAEEYNRRELFFCDPIFAEAALTGEKALAWNTVINRRKLTGAGHAVMSLAADFDVRDGMLLPVKGAFGKFGCLSFLTSNENLANEVSYKFSAALIHIAVECQRFSEQIAAGALDTVRLTNAECETLIGIAHGKRIKGTAALLNVSPECIKSRLESVRIKLGAQNATEACMIAVRDGHIFY